MTRERVQPGSHTARPFRFPGLATILMAVCGASSLSGCVSSMVEGMEIGRRQEYTVEHERAARSGNQLLLFYCVSPTPWAHPANANCRPKWSAIDLTTVSWRPLDDSEWKRLIDEPSDGAKVPIQDEPRPATPPGLWEEIPIVPVDPRRLGADGLIGTAGAGEYLRSLSTVRPFNVYVATRWQWLTLVVPNEKSPGDFLFAAVPVPYRSYRLWWSVPARAVAYTLSVPIDIATAPIQLPLIWWAAQALRE